MRLWLASILVALSLASPSLAGGKTVFDAWDIAYLGDGKAGHVHTYTKEVQVDGKKMLKTTVELRLMLRRFDGVVEMGMDSGTLENQEGKVSGIFMKQYLGRKQDKQIDGVVKENELHLTLNGNRPLKPAPWNDEVLGLYKQQILLKDRDAKPGDKFSYRSFEPHINLVLKADVNVKGYREVVVPGTKQKLKLLLAEVVPEKVDHKTESGRIDKVQLPASLIWFDDKFEQVKTETEIPGLGPLVLYRTTKEKALAPGPIANLDLGYNQLVRLKNRIVQPYETKAATYRITIRNDDNVATTFSQDERQQVKKVQGNTFELHVKVIRPADEGKGEAPGAEFTQSSYFITSDDAKVKEHAQTAVGLETDPWKQALRIERWVHANMKASNDEALATADHVARTLEGDCTEFAMLTAAMCRATGIPSRTAIGLIYADVKNSPCFAFHMWTEVWIKGRWIPIDATLGKGYVGATHLKITDHSWYDERTMTPIFPVIRVVGRVNIDVLEYGN